MLALEHRYYEISVLLIDIGVDVVYRHLYALAAVLIVIVLICNHAIHVYTAYALQYRQIIGSSAASVIYLPRACNRRLLYAPCLAPLETAEIRIAIRRYRRIIIDRVRYLKAYRCRIAAYGDIAVARVCSGQARRQCAR